MPLARAVSMRSSMPYGKIHAAGSMALSSAAMDPAAWIFPYGMDERMETARASAVAWIRHCGKYPGFLEGRLEPKLEVAARLELGSSLEPN